MALHRIYKLDQRVVLSIEGPFGLQDVESLGPLSEVQQLEIRNQPVHSCWPGRLSLPRLQVIYLNGPTAPVVELVQPENLIHIEHLLITNGDCELPSHGPPSSFRSLRKLYIRQRNLSHHDIAWVQEHRAIRDLVVTHSNITDTLLCDLRSAHSLETLDLFGTQVGFLDSRLRDISFPCVQHLDVSECRIVDESVSTLRRLFPSLVDLRIQENELSVVAMKELAKIPALKRFHCGHREIDFDLIPYWRD